MLVHWYQQAYLLFIFAAVAARTKEKCIYQHVSFLDHSYMGPLSSFVKAGYLGTLPKSCIVLCQGAILGSVTYKILRSHRIGGE